MVAADVVVVVVSVVVVGVCDVVVDLELPFEVVVLIDAFFNILQSFSRKHTCLQFSASHFISHVLPNSHTWKQVFTFFPHFSEHVLFCKHACWQSSASHCTCLHSPMAQIWVQFVACAPKQCIFVQ